MTLEFKNNTDYNNEKECVISMIKKVIDTEDIFLSHSTLNNLAIHLTMAIIRIKSNNYIPLTNAQIRSYKDEKNFDVALKICDRLAKEYHLTFPESELALVSMYLSKMDALDFEVNSGLDLLDDEVYDIIREVFHNIKETQGKDFTKNDRLYVAIGLHLIPALERLKDDQQIDNPLKEKIITRHPIEFNYAKEFNPVTKRIYNKEFTDAELAYIALHFVVTTINKKDA